MNHRSHLSWTLQGALRITSSSTVCNFLLHLSCYSIALNLLLTAYTLSPTFLNSLSLLLRMKPMPSQVRNHYSQKNQEAHLERAHAYKKAAHLRRQSNLCLAIIWHCALYCWWLVSTIELLTQDDNTGQQIGDDQSEYPVKSTSLCYINEDDLDHQQEVLVLGQACRHKSWWTTCVPQREIQSRANTFIAQHLLPNFWNPVGAMAQPLLKRQKSTLLNKLSKFDHGSSTQALLLPKFSGDRNAPQLKDSPDQHVPQHQKATFEDGKRFVKAIIFSNTTWPILSDNKYSMVGADWKLAIEAWNHQRALAGASIGTPSVCLFPCGLSHRIDPQTQEAVSLGFCLLLLYQISDIAYAPKYR